MRVKTIVNGKGEPQATEIAIPIEGTGGELGQRAVINLTSLISGLKTMKTEQDVVTHYHIICDFVIVGVKYGISEGMSAEIAAADAEGIEVVNADKLRYKLEYDRKAWLEEYAKLHACEFCRGSRLHTCTSYRCQQPYREAYKYAEKHFTSG